VRPRLRLRVTVSEGRYAVRDVSPDGADDGGGDGGGDLERAQRRARLINQPHVRAQVLAPLDATAAVGALLLTSDKAEYDGDDEEQQDDDASARPQPERDDEEQPLTKVNTTTAAATIAASSSPIKSVSEGEGKGDGRGTEAKGEEDPFPKKQRTTTAKEGIIDLAGIVAETIGDPESAVLNAPRPPASRLGRLVSDSLLSEPARDEDVIKGSEAIQEDRQASLCAAGVTAGGADKSSEALVIDSVGKETPLEKCSTSSTAKSVIESGKEKTDAKIRGGNSSETPVEKNEASGQPTRPAGNAQEGGSSRELQVKGEKRCDKSENIGEKKKSDIKEVKSEAKAPKEEVADDEDELPEEELDPLWITPPTSEPPSSPESIKIISSEEEAEEDDKRVYKGKKKSTADSGPAAKHSEPQVKVKEGCKSSADNPAKEVVKAPSEKATTSAEGTEEPAGPISKEGTGTADRESGQPETAEKRPSKSEIENRAGKSAPTSSEKRGDISEKAYSTLGKDITALTPGAEEVIAKPVCSKEARPSVGDVAGDRPELKSTAVEAVKGGGGANEEPVEDAIAKKPLTCEDRTKTAADPGRKSDTFSEPESVAPVATSSEGGKKAAAEAWQSLADRIAVKAALKRVIHEVEMRVGSAASVSNGKIYDSATAAAVAATAGVPAAAAAEAKVAAVPPPPLPVTTPPSSPPSRQLHQLPPTSPSPNKSYSTKPGPASKKYLPRKRKHGEVSGPSPKSLLTGGESTAMRISHELPGCNWLEEKIKKAKVVKANASTAADAAAAGSNGASSGCGDGQKVKNSTKRKEDSQPTQPLKSKSDGGSQESPQHQEKVRKNKFSDGDVVHKKVSGKPAITRDAGTLTRAASTDVKAIQVSLPGPEGIRDADLMYMSKNLNQRIQESYERTSAQTLHKLNEEKRELFSELERMRREHKTATEEIEDVRKRKQADVEEVRTLFLQKQKLVSEVAEMKEMVDKQNSLYTQQARKLDEQKQQLAEMQKIQKIQQQEQMKQQKQMEEQKFQKIQPRPQQQQHQVAQQQQQQHIHQPQKEQQHHLHQQQHQQQQHHLQQQQKEQQRQHHQQQISHLHQRQQMHQAASNQAAAASASTNKHQSLSSGVAAAAAAATRHPREHPTAVAPIQNPQLGGRPTVAAAPAHSPQSGSGRQQSPAVAAAAAAAAANHVLPPPYSFSHLGTGGGNTTSTATVYSSGASGSVAAAAASAPGNGHHLPLGSSASAQSSHPTNPYFNEQYNMAYAAAAAAGHRIPNAHHLQMERQQHIRQQQEQIMQWKRQQHHHKQQQQQQQLQRAAAAAAHGLHGQQPAHAAPRDHPRLGTAHLLAEAMDKASVSESDAASQNPAMCKACKKEASFMCSACRGAHYCSLECQRKNWVEHSKFCVQRK